MKCLKKFLAVILSVCLIFSTMSSAAVAASSETLWHGDDISYDVKAGPKEYKFMSVYPARAYEMSNHMVTSNGGEFNSIPQSLVLIEANDDYNWKPNGKYQFGSSNYEVTYCCDRITGYEDSMYYKRSNLEDSLYYSKEDAAHIRSIVTNSYPYVSLEQMKANLAAEGFEGAQDLTRADVIAAVQSAIWYYSNKDEGLVYSRTFDVPTNSQWGTVFHDYTNEMDVWWQVGKRKTSTNDVVGARINALIQHLTKQEKTYPEKNQMIISDVEIVDVIPVQEKSDLYKMAVQVKLNNSGSSEEDQIKLKLNLDDAEVSNTDVSLGKETYDFIIEANMNQQISAEFEGNQIVPQGVYFYEPESGRNQSQCLVGVAGGNTEVHDIEVCDVDYEVGEVTKDVVINKLNENGDSLANAEFELYVYGQDSKILVDTYNTDENGKLVIEKLLPGKYEVVETNAPEGYLLDEDPIVFTIDENGNLSVEENGDVSVNEDGAIDVLNKSENPIEDNDSDSDEEQGIVGNEDDQSHKNKEVKKENKVDVPETGDNTPVEMLIAMMILSLGSAFVFFRKKE
ncbi:MAG: SpaA isopeptide-forming pilin-related protein [Eubacterium sp.]|nr:SpaA isopeptide-forming pilin-related protein [Eubacterium sp.]